MKISKKDALTWFRFFAELPEDEELLTRQTELVYATMYQIETAVEAQNARLAAKLIGWKINIDKEEAAAADAEAGQYADMQAQIRQAVDLFVTQCGVSEEVAMALVGNGYHSIEGLREATVEELADIDGIDEATAAQLYAAVRQ